MSLRERYERSNLNARTNELKIASLPFAMTENYVNLSMKNPYVYFLSNKNNTVIYISVTSNLVKRIHEHKTRKYKGFLFKYNCNKLVYYEQFSNMNDAIVREKQLKSGNRKRKESLINKENPDWLDLSEDWVFDF